MALKMVAKGADFSAFNIGNIYGLPALPVTGIRFAHLTRASLAASAENLAKINKPAELTAISTPTYESTYVRLGQSNQALNTGKAPTDSWTHVAVYRAIEFQFWAISTALTSSPTTDTPGAQGLTLQQGAAPNAPVTRIGYYDGESGAWTALAVTAPATVAASNWVMVAHSYDAATRTLSIYTPWASGTKKASAQHPEGTVIDHRGGRTIRLGGIGSNSAGSNHDVAFFAGWSRALTDDEIYNVVYPNLKSYLATKSIEVL